MSQLLCRIAKVSSSKRLCFGELRSLSTAAAPYLLLEETNRRASGNDEVVADINLYDPSKEERVKIPDQTLSKELCYSMKIGSSRGWVALRSMHDSRVRLTNIYNPCASVSSHKVITLPPLDKSKEARVCSISLSASPNQQDCVMAAKSLRSFLFMCETGDSEWTNIGRTFCQTEMMYSVRDRQFYLCSSSKAKKGIEGPIDFIKTSSDFPQLSLYPSFPLPDIPKIRQAHLLSTVLTTQYLVESPSGDSLVVYWCKEFLTREEIESTASYRMKPRAFMVFRQDPEQRISSYTEDIGDLCIFLSRSEAFCVSATDYPGLKPNSVYYAGCDAGFGYYDLGTSTLYDLTDDGPLTSFYMWLAPLQ